MRQYYCFNGERIYSFDASFCHFIRYPEQLYRRAARFVKEYCFTRRMCLYLKAHEPFFGEPVGLHGFYFYIENDKAYEFFTGIEIGRVSQRSNDRVPEWVWIKGQYHCDIACTDADTENIVAFPLTESQFAYDIKPFIQYKDRISAAIKKCLEIRHDMWFFYTDQENKKKEHEQLRNNYDSSFLKDF